MNSNTKDPEHGSIFWARFAAFVVDGILINVISFVIQWIVIKTTGSFLFGGWNAETLYLIVYAFGFVYLLVAVAYYGYFYSKVGATPGKMLLNLKVVDGRTGSHLKLSQTIVREIFKFLSLLILGGGFFMAAFRVDRKALHDLIANTKVIKAH